MLKPPLTDNWRSTAQVAGLTNVSAVLPRSMSTTWPPRCGCDGSTTSPEIVCDPVPVVIECTQSAAHQRPLRVEQRHAGRREVAVDDGGARDAGGARACPRRRRSPPRCRPPPLPAAPPVPPPAAAAAVRRRSPRHRRRPPRRRSRRAAPPLPPARRRSAAPAAAAAARRAAPARRRAAASGRAPAAAARRRATGRRPTAAAAATGDAAGPRCPRLPPPGCRRRHRCRRLPPPLPPVLPPRRLPAGRAALFWRGSSLQPATAAATAMSRILPTRPNDVASALAPCSAFVH